MQNGTEDDDDTDKGGKHKGRPSCNHDRVPIEVALNYLAIKEPGRAVIPMESIHELHTPPDATRPYGIPT